VDDRTTLKPVFLGAPLQALLGLVMAAIAWEILRISLALEPVFLPPLSRVGAEVLELMTTSQGLGDILISLRRVILGFLVASIIAIPLGIVFSQYRLADRMFSPVVEFLRYIPIICFVPVSIYWLGLSESQKIFVLVLGTFCQLTPMVYASMAGVPAEVVSVYTALHRGRRGIVRSVLLPAAAPQIYDALRISLGITWTYLIVAEVVGATSGLGFIIIQAQRYLQSDRLFAAMVIIGLIGVLSDALVKAARRRVFPWDRNYGHGS
jgi:NitT/TauT family transport system permease protein